MVSKRNHKEETERRSFTETPSTSRTPGRPPIENVLDALRTATGREPIKAGDGWKACCPAHDDHNPSLSVSEGDDGRVLLNCLAGCCIDDVLAAARLEKRDLFPESSGCRSAGIPAKSSTRQAGTRTPKPAKAAGPVWPSSSAAIAELERQRGPRAAAWTYRDADGEPVGTVVRWDLADGGKDIRPLRRGDDGWSLGTLPEPRPLYWLPDIINADVVYVVEGEKAADAMRSIGLTATTSQGGSNAAHKSDWSPLSGKTVVIIPDNDEPGRKYAATVASILSQLDPPAVVYIVDLADDWPELPDKGDADDWCEHFDSVEPEVLRERIEALAATVEPWEPATNSEPGPRARPTRRAILQRFSDIEPETLRWLWAGRIPSGMLTVISGNPAAGKSFIIADIVARVTTGRPWPDDSANDDGPGDVVLVNVEDAVSVVQRPRLDAADADVTRVRRIDRVELTNGDDVVESRTFSIADAAEVLRSAVEQLDRPRLIVLDPLAAFLAGVRSNDQGDIRAAFSPLVQLAEDFDVAIVFVHHNRKGTGSHPSERLAGSLQIGATVRQSWEVVGDPDDEGRRLFLPGKNSNARDRGGLAFQIVDSDIPLSDTGDFVGRVEWQPGSVDPTADQVAFQAIDEESRDPWPIEWLSDYLSDGAKPVRDVQTAAKAVLVSEKQLRTARGRLKITTRKSDFKGGWIWELPDDAAGSNETAVTPPDAA
ncbi:AAA family ATPase [bacterium]|nr:AAA family ATPase [bacterium]